MPRDIDGIVDDIDALVDAQLAQEPTGYDYSIGQARCPHCQRHWHGMPLTEHIADMYAEGEYQLDYNYAADTSPIVCPGSEFIGPMPPGHDYNGDTLTVRRDIGYIDTSDDGLLRSWFGPLADRMRIPDARRQVLGDYVAAERYVDRRRWWQTILTPGTDAELQINRELIDTPRGADRMGSMIDAETVTLRMDGEAETFPMHGVTYRVETGDDLDEAWQTTLYALAEQRPSIGAGWVPVTDPGDTRNPLDNEPRGYTRTDLSNMRNTMWENRT